MFLFLTQKIDYNFLSRSVHRFVYVFTLMVLLLLLLRLLLLLLGANDTVKLVRSRNCVHFTLNHHVLFGKPFVWSQKSTTNPTKTNKFRLSWEAHIRLKIITNAFIVFSCHRCWCWCCCCSCCWRAVVYNVYFLCRMIASVHEAFTEPTSFAKVLSKSIAYKIFISFIVFFCHREEPIERQNQVRWQQFSARCHSNKRFLSTQHHAYLLPI